jgi:hypothetical protein
MPPGTPAPAPASEGHAIHGVIMALQQVIESNDQPDNVDDHSRLGQQQLFNLIKDMPHYQNPGS